jgi:ATP-binding cassette, subfamily B, bacterial MsbA
MALPSAAETRAVYGRLLRYALPWRGEFLVGAAGMALYAATDAGIAMFVDRFLKATFVHPDPRVVWAVPLGVLLLFTLRGLGDFLANWYPGRVGRQVVKAIRRDLFEQYLHLPIARYDRESTGRMLSRLTYDAEQVAEAATSALVVLVRDSLALTGLLVYMFWRSWWFTLLALSVAPLVGLAIGVINRRFRRYSTRIQQSMGDVTRVTKESLDMQRAIRTSGAEAQQSRRFEEVNEQNRASQVRLQLTRAAATPVVQLVAGLGLAIVLVVALTRVVAASIPVNEFVGYITALMLLMAPLKRVVNIGGPLAAGIAAGHGIFAVLDEPREPAGGGHALRRARGEVEYRNVGFDYGDGAVLRDISFRVGPGETLAIVGRSGAGKSTLVGLLPRLYEPGAGRILLDGVDLREYPLTDLRRQLAYVGQDALLLDDSLRNNIALGVEDASEEAILAAARCAHVLEFAQGMPQGLDSAVGERGALLSGGQRQRVAIARALLRGAPVLVLDEATSQLDSESERHVQEAIAELRRGRAMLVIAHRLATAEAADRIIVLQDGVIVETGRHAELLALGGVYSQLYRLQFDA